MLNPSSERQETAATAPAEADKKIRSLSSFLDHLKAISPPRGNIIAYRGHEKTHYVLLPSVLRNLNRRDKEHTLVQEVMALHPSEFSHDSTTFDQLVRMQHHWVPTRLLDITFNPLMALFFCCEKGENEDGHVIQFSTANRKLKYFDSDAVSLLANLSHLTARERGELMLLAKERGEKGIIFNKLHDSLPGQKLLSSIHREKPYFKAKFHANDLVRKFIVKPKQSNDRIAAQQGAFIIFGLHTSLRSQDNSGITANYITVDGPSKGKIINELDRLGINLRSVYPSLTESGRYLTRSTDDGIF